MPMSREDAVYAAAEAVAGKPPLPWWVETVQVTVNSIAANSESRARFPTRKALRGRLNDVRQGAQLLAREFNESSYRDEDSYAVIAFLMTAGLDPKTINALRLAVPKLLDYVKSAPPIRMGKGRDKAFPNPEAMSPYDQCAGLVVWGWHHLRGTSPSRISNEVHRACEAVWKATGLRRAHFGDSLNGWRTHLATIERDLDGGSPAAEAGLSFQLFWRGLTDMAKLHSND
jgi:hypothetical protein